MAEEHAYQPAHPSESTSPAESLGFVDFVDERGIPVSAGIPPIIRISAVIGLIIIFAVGGIVIYGSAYGHVWPSSDISKIQLSTPAP